MLSIRLQQAAFAIFIFVIACAPAMLVAQDAAKSSIKHDDQEVALPERIDLLEQKVRNLAAKYIEANALLDEIWDELDTTTDRRDELDKAIQTYERILLQDAARLDAKAGHAPAPPAETPARVLETDGPVTVAPGRNVEAVQQRLKSFRDGLIAKLENRKQPAAQQPLPAEPSPRLLFTLTELELDLVFIPESNDNTTSFWVGRFEITQHQYARIMGMPSEFNEVKLRTRILARPVENVSWSEASMFCIRLTREAQESGLIDESHAFRLPTAAEWEYACRAGTSTAYSFGDDPQKLASHAVADSLSDAPQHVGSKQANPWGLFDMHGNVAEWCNDTPADNREQRIVAGGNFGSPPAACTSDARTAAPAQLPRASTGLRVVLVNID